MAWRFKADADNHILSANVPGGDATACGFVMQSVNRATFSFPFGFDDNSSGAAAQNWYFETAVDGKSIAISWRNTVATGGTGPVVVVIVPYTWYFLCLRRSGTTMTGFARQVGSGNWLKQSTTSSGTIVPTTFRIGGDAAVFPNEFWNGRVCGVRLWDLALTDSEIFRESYQLAPATRRHRLVAAWLDQGYDTNGKARNLTKGTAAQESDPPVPRFSNQPFIFRRINSPVVDDGSPWILNWQDDSEPNEEDVVDDSLRPFLVENAPAVTDDSETRQQVDLDADAGVDEPEFETQTLTVEESPQLVVDVDPEIPEADDDPAGAQITVDVETPALLADDQIEEPEFVDDAFIIVVLDDETTLVLTEQDDEPELDTVTLDVPATQPDDPPAPGDIEPALLAWVDLDEFHPELEFGLEILIGPTDDPPAQTNYVWIHRARRRGNR